MRGFADASEEVHPIAASRSADNDPQRSQMLLNLGIRQSRICVHRGSLNPKRCGRLRLIGLKSFQWSATKSSFDQLANARGEGVHGEWLGENMHAGVEVAVA
jgi:hypothetical protein